MKTKRSLVTAMMLLMTLGLITIMGCPTNLTTSEAASYEVKVWRTLNTAAGITDAIYTYITQKLKDGDITNERWVEIDKKLNRFREAGKTATAYMQDYSKAVKESNEADSISTKAMLDQSILSLRSVHKEVLDLLESFGMDTTPFQLEGE